MVRRIHPLHPFSQCVVDLEERRCKPYMNSSDAVPMVHQGKPGDIDMAGLSSRSNQVHGPQGIGNIGTSFR